MSTFHLKIIAYDKIFYDDEAASVVLPAIDGEVQILTNHEECVVALKTGEVRIGTPKGEMIPAVCGNSGGYDRTPGGNRYTSCERGKRACRRTVTAA